jgi:hypothetical protein
VGRSWERAFTIHLNNRAKYKPYKELLQINKTKILIKKGGKDVDK